MEIGNKVGFGMALGAVAVAIILLVASAAGVIPRYTQRPAQLTEGPYAIVRGPDSVRLSDDMVLYSRYGKTSVHDNASNLMVTVWDNGTYVYDIDNHREYKVAKEVLDASISHNLVAWSRDNGIIVKNIFNGSETVLPLANAKPNDRPEIEGDRIVWVDSRNGPSQIDIYSYNLTTGEETRLTSQANASVRGPPFLRGDMVFWAENSSSIHAYHFSNRTEVALTDGGSHKFSPKGSSRLVAWLDDRNAKGPGQLDLYYLDLRNMNQFRLTSERAVESYDVWGGKVVYSDTTRKEAPGNSGDIYVFDIAKNKTKVYYSSQWSQYSPAIGEGRIVWVDGSKAGAEIFTMKKADTRYAGMDLMTMLFALLVLGTAASALGAYRMMVAKDEEDREAYEQKAAKRRRGRGLK